MAVLFKPQDHSYHSIDPLDNIRWLSVTTVISHFKQPFDPQEQSKKSARNKRSKWYGMSPAEIQEVWAAEGKRAVDLGTFYHNQRETDLFEFSTIERSGKIVPIVRPVVNNGVKEAPLQKLADGLYPEHFVYLKSAGICGQSDLIEVVNGIISITDYKTNKEIRTQGFKNWEGITQKMHKPVSHLDDCHLNHYALQLSLYLYIICKHNPLLKPGKLSLHHVTFHEAGKDRYGNPITKMDPQGNPLVNEVKVIDVPYYKREILDILNWVDDNRNQIVKK